MTPITEYTIVYELNGLTAWTGYVQQLPEIGKVQGNLLIEVQGQLSSRLVKLLMTAHNKNFSITTTFHYPLAHSSQQLSNN